VSGYDEAFLDFYSVHFYDSLNFPNWRPSLNNILEHDSSEYGFIGKPLLISEASWAGIRWAGSTVNIYHMVYERQWAGIAGWHLLANGRDTDTRRDLLGAMLSLQELPGCEAINLNYPNTRVPPKQPRVRFSGMQAKLDLLQSSVVSFWLSRTWDESNGGCVASLDRSGNPVPASKKSVVQHAHHLWAVSAAYARVKPVDTVGSLAHKLYTYLMANFTVVVGPRVEFAWYLNQTGHVVDSRRPLYAQAAAIDALVMYGVAFNVTSAIDQALDVFRSIDSRAHDEVHGGYLENNDTGLLTGSATRSAMTHRRLLQAFLNLHAFTMDPLVRSRVRELTGIMVERRGFFSQLNSGLAIFAEQFDDTWNVTTATDSDGFISVGSQLETARLLMEAAASGALNTTQSVHVAAAAQALAVSVVDMATDDVNGGFMNSLDLASGVRVSESGKTWWVQTEAIHALWLLYDNSVDERFARLMESTIKWIEVKQVDLDVPRSEWLTKVSADGCDILDGRKGGEWKTPYEIVRSFTTVSSAIGLQVAGQLARVR